MRSGKGMSSKWSFNSLRVKSYWTFSRSARCGTRKLYPPSSNQWQCRSRSIDKGWRRSSWSVRLTSAATATRRRMTKVCGSRLLNDGTWSDLSARRSLNAFGVSSKRSSHYSAARLLAAPSGLRMISTVREWGVATCWWNKASSEW